MPHQLGAAAVKHRCYAAVRQAFAVPLCDVADIIFVVQNLRSNNFSGCAPVPHQLGAAAVKHRCYAARRQAFAVPLCDVEGTILSSRICVATIIPGAPRCRNSSGQQQ